MPADHLDDEILSALLDGADEATGARHHLAGCPACTARLARLGDAARLVASPVAPLDAATVDRLLDHALTAPVVPIASRRRRAAAIPPPWLVAAAAALLLVVGIPALIRADRANHRGSTTSLAAKNEAADRTASGAASGGAVVADQSSQSIDAAAPTAASGAASAGPAAVVVGDDLGDLGDADSVIAGVRAELNQTARQSGGTKAAGAPAPTCLDQAKRAGGSDLGDFVYIASARWKGQSAEVLVFLLDNPSGDVAHQAYVMSRSDCAVLASPRL